MMTKCERCREELDDAEILRFPYTAERIELVCSFCHHLIGYATIDGEIVGSQFDPNQGEKR